MKYQKKSCKYLLDNRLSIATAESLTGGMIASELVGYPGISECFSYGYITYSDDAKEEVLGVRKTTLEKYGAVSHQTAREMAKYVRAISNADIGIASTGFAGPTGGNKENPVGTVYVSCSIDDFVITRKFLFKGSRFLVRTKTVNAAFKLLYDCIKRYRP